MTHLGINSAAATAARGFQVLGCGEHSVIERLRAGEIPVSEPGLKELVAEHAQRISFTSESHDLANCDIVYISADVPTDDTGSSDLEPIRRLIDVVTPHLRRDAILVILCQVPPGFTRALAQLPHDRLFYQVETLIFGRAVDRALNPERFIVGCESPHLPLPKSYRDLLSSFGCPILCMRYESAELAKISINFCLVATVTVANTLAELSEQVGADWNEIVPALKLDNRIGQAAYLNAGLGISGGNLERDLQTVLNLSEGNHVDTSVIRAWMHNSAHRKDWCWRILKNRLLDRKPNARIGVLGLAYKEDTHSTKTSPALSLLAHLKGFDVRIHDPVVPTSIVPFAVGCNEPIDCANDADALVIITPWNDYKKLSIQKLAKAMKGRLLVDPYRLLEKQEPASHGFEYHMLGRSPMMPGQSG